MSKSASPTWALSDEWAVTRDKYNWILLRTGGSRPRSDSFYPTPELLLKSLHRKISRAMPAKTDLLDHLEVAYKAGERLSDRLSDHIHASLGIVAKLTPQQADTSEEFAGEYVGTMNDQRLRACSCDRSDELKADDNENCL